MMSTNQTVLSRRQRRADHRAFAGHDPGLILRHARREGNEGRRHGLLERGRGATMPSDAWRGASAIRASRPASSRSTRRRQRGLENGSTTHAPPGSSWADLLPVNAKAPFDWSTAVCARRRIAAGHRHRLPYCGQKERVIFCDQIMSMGFIGGRFRAGNLLRQGPHGHPRAEMDAGRRDPRLGQGKSNNSTWTALDHPG